MKKLIVAAALGALLVGCDQAAEESDEPAATPVATETTAAESMAGTYEFEVDGKKTTSVINADGTYADSQDGTVVEAGTWTEADSRVCFDPEGDDIPQACFTTTEPDADGVFTATAEDGTVLTIRKVA